MTLRNIFKKGKSYTTVSTKFSNGTYTTNYELGEGCGMEVVKKSIKKAEEGHKLENSGNKIKAMECYNEAVKIFPYNVSVINDIGLIYSGNKKYDKAMGYFDKALEMDPNFKWALINKADVHRQLKNYSESIKCYKKILKIDPNDPFAEDCIRDLKNKINKSRKGIASKILSKLNV